MTELRHDDGIEYLIAYPTNQDQRYLGPIVHELAHVMQLSSPGGLRNADDSRKVELGADFIAGLVFQRALQGIDVEAFQHGLALTGLYYESADDGHGSPEARLAAFRWGLNFKLTNDIPDIRAAARNFDEEFYLRGAPGSIVARAVVASRDAAAPLSLDKLDACAQVDAVMASLLDSRNAIDGLCRMPKDAFERIIVARQGANPPGFDYCFSQPPSIAPSLKGYACVQSSFDGSRSMSCFRSVDPRALDQYKREYSTYEPRVRSYLEAAQRCQAPRREATNDPSIVTMALLMHVARPDFGYRLGFVDDGMKDRFVQHGFARIDPSLPESAPAAIEYVNFVVGARGSRSATQERRFDLGDDILTVTEQGLAENLRLSRSAQDQFKLNDIEFELERKPLRANSAQAADAMLSKLAAALRRVLLTEAFTSVTATAAQRKTLNALRDRMPYGMHGALPRTGRLDMSFFLNESPAACPGDGAIMAFIVTLQPSADRPRDRGAVSAMLVRAGTCAESSAAATYVENLVRDLRVAAHEVMGIGVEQALWFDARPGVSKGGGDYAKATQTIRHGARIGAVAGVEGSKGRSIGTRCPA